MRELFSVFVAAVLPNSGSYGWNHAFLITHCRRRLVVLDAKMLVLKLWLRCLLLVLLVQTWCVWRIRVILTFRSNHAFLIPHCTDSVSLYSTPIYGCLSSCCGVCSPCYHFGGLVSDGFGFFQCIRVACRARSGGQLGHLVGSSKLHDFASVNTVGQFSL